MLKDTVWDVRGRAFESCDGELVDCIMSALEAAESEGEIFEEHNQQQSW